jgi:alkaline phosphatase
MTCSILYRAARFVTVLSVIALLTSGATAKGPKDGKPRKPKNVFILISDGCGFNHVLAADYYAAGKARAQEYEKFPERYACSTFSYYGSYDPELAWSSFDQVMSGATDSASAGTAISAGIKTYDAGIGVDIDGNPAKHLMERAEELDKATGVVTSVEFSHATPAAFVAHNVSRNNYSAIANEMLVDSAADVIIGCGHPFYDDNGSARTPTSSQYGYVGGKTTWEALTDSDGDGTGLVGADADGDGTADEWTFIEDLADFEKLAKGKKVKGKKKNEQIPARLCGVPRVYTTLQQNRGGDRTAEPFAVALNSGVPTLRQMTLAALTVLSRDKDGFVVMVEGGAVDWAGHANQMGRMIEEQGEFNDMVDAVCDWIEGNGGWGDNLVIVTADHETGYLLGPDSAADGTWNPLVNNGKGEVPGHEWNSGNHTNSLVPFYARGSGARLFGDRVVGADPVHGKYIDNTSIAKVIFSLFE